jgi:hypothetical protein
MRQAQISTERRLLRAGKRLHRYWFPINDTLLTNIRKGFSDGVYELDSDFLLSELRNDFALFGFVLKEFTNKRRKVNKKFELADNPFETLRRAPLSELKQILCDVSKTISEHSLGSSSKIQLERIADLLVSTSTSETLAEKSEIGSEKAFTAAFIRGLARVLIAFNYPSIFARAAEEKAVHESIDDYLSRLLGYSIELLGTSIGKDLGFSDEYLRTIFLSAKQSSTLEDEKEDLWNLCHIGECLARANHPELYPNARQNWEIAEEAIQDKLGKDGFKSLTKKIQLNSESYNLVQKNFSSEILDFRPYEKFREFDQRSRFRDNDAAQSLPPKLMRSFELLYETLPNNQVSSLGVRQLLKTIVPLAGFTAGAVYLIDPSKMLLVPRTTIGDLQLENLHSLDYAPSMHNNGTVVQAFRSNTPVVESGFMRKGDRTTSMSTVLGKSKRAGVLYLELPEDHFSLASDQYHKRFKAIAQALCDCLNIQ